MGKRRGEYVRNRVSRTLMLKVNLFQVFFFNLQLSCSYYEKEQGNCHKFIFRPSMGRKIEKWNISLVSFNFSHL